MSTTAVDARFRAVRRLGAAGSETMLARDLLQDRMVVVKRLAGAGLSAAARARVAHDAALLGADGGGRLALPIEVVGAGADLVVVRPFVPGIGLDALLADGPLHGRDALEVGRLLMSSLQALHERGVLHRNLKPANVVVAGRDNPRAGALVDVGIAVDEWREAAVPRLVEAARYLSPEQAGSLDRAADERSDLYSAGIVLFECLAGRPPFEGASVGALLRQHVAAQPPELRGLGHPLPRGLDDLVQRLLRKDPRDRYGSAAAVLADIEELAEAMDRGEADPAVVVGQRDRRRSLTEPAFVGRVGELAALEAQLDGEGAWRGGLVQIESQSGGGKTRLLDELARMCGARGVWVLRGQAVSESAQRPFQILDGVAARLVGAARSDPELAAQLRARVGDHADAVCAAIPELSEALRPDGVSSLGPEGLGETRTLEALTRLLDALGATGRPAVVLLDDCQWADEATVRLLGHWRRSRAREGEQLLVVTAFRSEEVEAHDPLRRLDAALHLTLAPFAPLDLRRLLESMAGGLPDEAVEVVERLSEGNPFMASAVLRGLVEVGALVDGAAGWRVEPLALDDVRSSRRAAVFLTRRLELLPERALDLLSVGAVLGKEFALDLAASLAGQSATEAVAGLAEARRRHIVWADDDGSRWSFVHDKLRENLLGRLPDDDRRALHARAAERIEAIDASRAFELAYHFDAAGASVRALPYALTAARLARERHALEVAERQYRIAERGAGGAGAAVERQIAEGLGDVLMLRGRYEAAREQLERARALAATPAGVAEVETRLGELAFKRGEVTLAAEALETALGALGRRVPRGGLAFLMLALVEIAVQVAHTLAPRLFLARRSLRGAEEEFLAIRIYSRLAYAYWFKRGAIATLWAHLREMNLAERYPPTPELAQAYSEHAPVMSVIPLFRRGITYAERSLAIRQDLGDVWGQGQSLHFHGVVLYGASRFEECIERCREAVRLLERTGDRWEVNTANWHIAFCHYRLGDLRAAAEVARRVHEAGVEIGDHQASGISLGAWAKATGGRVPAELVQAMLERCGDDVHTGAEVLQAEGVRLLGEGDPVAAAEALADALQRVRRAGLRQEYVAPVPCWLASALREQAEAASALDPRRGRRLRRSARRMARRAWWLARSYRNNLPHALRELALVAALDGRERRARRLLAASLAEAERQGARHERAQTLLARGRVGTQLGWPGAAAELAAAEEEIATLPGAAASCDGAPAGPVTLSLTDRFDTVLDEGRRIASALTPDAIYDAVREAALSLLRGQECQIVRMAAGPDGDDVVVEDGDALPAPLARMMAERSAEAGRPIVLGDEPALDELAADVAAEGGVRSALCAPIFVRGRAAACVCVTHADVAALFGPDEARLAEFVATIAGAALENAEGFAEVAALSRSLERRVEERTTELAASNRALDASLRRVQALLESLSDGVVACDSEGRLTIFNRASRDFHGMSAEPMPPERWAAHYELYLPDGSPMPPDQVPLMRALRGERVRDVEMIIGARGGRRLTVLASGQQIVDRDGSALGAVVALRDVTERKRAERALEEATRRLESILGAAGEGICGLDARGRITYANPAAARLTGYPVEALIGRTIDELLLRQRADEAEGASVPGQPPREHQAIVRRRDGSTFAAEYVLTGVDHGAGAAVLIMRDVSERRAVQQLKDEFVALASHELRTPLTSILGYLEVVLEDLDRPLHEEQRRLLRIAQRNAKRLAHLVSDVLLAAQADAGRLQLGMGLVDLAALVEECVEGIRPTAEERGLTVVVDAPPLPPMVGDQARLAQVLDNLVSNALKFTPPGGRVGVTLAQLAGRAVIEVTDTGIGIPERERELLFSRFYRASSAVEAAVPGTGLGLAITKMIVEGHGGEVRLESREGLGTTLRVLLPLVPATAGEAVL